MKLLGLGITSCAMLFGAAAMAQSASPAASKSIEIRRTATPPTIDGSLLPAEWQDAALIEDLHQVSPVEYASPSERTQVYVMYDSDALYIGARLFDSQPQAATANILRQGEDLDGDDRIAVVIDPFNDGRSGYSFTVNMHGVRRQALYENASEENFDWKGIWHVRTSRDAEGWVAEMVIPFKTLSFNPNSDTWGFNVQRNVTRRTESIGWSSRNQEINPSTAGRITGLQGMNQGIGLDLVPSLTLRHDKVFDPARSAQSVEPSLDVFYKITPALTAALTVNTDFSATEVDDRQVNLSRFGLFFPEKRAFFLQDADIFEFGRLGSGGGAQFSGGTLQNGRPFFSRRIGLAGDGTPVDLRVGAKLTGRIGEWSVGLLDVQQAAYDGVDSRNLFVGRAAVNVLEESTVGAILTHGDPRSNLSNTLVGADFRYRNSRLPGSRILESEIWYQQSDTEGVSGDDAAWGLRLQSPNSIGLRGGVGVKEIQRNFYPALGFVNNTGIRDHTAYVGYTRRSDSRLLRTLYSGAELQHIRFIDGGLQTESLKLRALEIETDAGDALEFTYWRTREGIDEDFEIFPGVTVPVGQYEYAEYEIAIGAADHRPISGEVGIRWGDFLDGRHRAYEGEIVLRPSPHFALAAEYEYNDIDLPQGGFITRVMSLRLDLVFSSTLSWSNLLQYDNESELVGFNSRLQWIPEAGRETYLVVNHALQDFDRDGRLRSANADIVLKVGYTLRF